MLREYIEHGLFEGRKLLVLDMELCTRCDECTKACSDTHQGITRLVRDGLRIDKWLVASSCRSCSDPYCLVGCPVDAIHRDGQGKQIQIESHCIGCGLCMAACSEMGIDALRMAKALEPYRLFFLEDPLAPDQIEWFRRLREQSATPIAMGRT